ncbi:MAG: Gfo/Idh/MocA family oxidoreductase, partial [Armatimonadetes bacterium]|nr:Gfo/Idh/MocA family oxidoreductase [Armatimonadota bacterium]
MSHFCELGCGVVGVGWMGERHARVWSEIPFTSLRAVYDIDRERAEQVASRYGCDVAESLDDLVGRDDVQIVSICTPDNLHVEPSVAAAKARKHLLIEKPLATTVPDAKAIIDAVRESGVVAMVGHIVRFDARYWMAREQVRAGALGDLIYAYARRYNIIDSAERIAPRSTVSFFLGIHDVDAIRWITGRRIV